MPAFPEEGVFFSQLGKRSIRRDSWGLCRDQDAYGCPDVVVFEFGGHCLADCVWIAALAMNVECRRVIVNPAGNVEMRFLMVADKL